MPEAVLRPLLVIGDYNLSSWSLRPWLFLRHNGIPFDSVCLPLDTEEFERRIGDYSPTRRVPVLRIGDEVIHDSLAICETANERWLQDRGWPQQAQVRAAARCAVAEMHSGFAALRKQLSMDVMRVPTQRHWDADAQRDIDRVQAIWSDLRSRFGGDDAFLCGRFGIVDAFFAPVVWRFLGYGVPCDAVSAAYVQFMSQLPAMQEWRSEAQAEVAARQ